VKLVRNSGDDRVIDRLRAWIVPGVSLELMTPVFSVHAFSEIRDLLSKSRACRLLLGSAAVSADGFFGGPADISYRNKLQGRWLARITADWLNKQCEVRRTPAVPSQSLILIGAPDFHAMVGTCSFSSAGLGLTPDGQLGLVQATDRQEEASAFEDWFRSNWDSIKSDAGAKKDLVGWLTDAAAHRAPSLVYFQMLFQLFKDLGEELDEERIIKSATGIRNTVVWQ